MKFDPNKSYSVMVWDMPVAVYDNDADDYVKNPDGTIKLFNIPNYDYSYICDDIDTYLVDFLEERSEYDDNT